MKIEATDKPRVQFVSVDVTATMPPGFDKRHQTALERAAEGGPLKNIFARDIPVRLEFVWP